ncbi:MAG TPA: serine/threonine-protein kinase [Kofleriaceae bacterium]|nr:serine/threonine-protein kinase [Kofleriaceae bacterium]
MAEGAIRPELPARIGRYQVLGYLADGGMAEIFLGREPGGGPVVIKRILPHLARQGNFVAMFIDEARIGSLVRHPNVVSVHELGQVGTDLFLVMEYLAGETVSGLIRRVVARGERLPLALGAYIVAEACAGLHAAHELADESGKPLGLVHRDISPSNVFVTYQGEVKVLDFGIATAAHRLTRTATGQVKGKFSYMSPEQCRGEVLDLRSDIFSLGVVLYELTVQRRLFKRPNELMVLKAVTQDSIPRPRRAQPDYPEQLERVVLRALARDKERRFGSALELRDELLAAIGALGIADPQRELAGAMAQLFAERIAEKRQLVKWVRLGSDVAGHVPAGEVDENIEVPQAMAHTETEAPLPSMPAHPRRGRAWIVLGLVTCLAAAAMLWWYLQQRDDAPVASPAVEPPPPAPAPPAGFTLHVDSSPPGASLFIDGKLAGTTPFALHLDGPRKLTLRVELAGYAAPAEQEFAIDREESLVIPLAGLPAAPPPQPPAAPAPAPPRQPIAHPPVKKKPGAKSDPFQRFD